MKCEDKIAEVKEENIKIEDKEEEIKSLPLPEQMPIDHNGKLIDTRIPADLKPLVKQTSGYFMVSFKIFNYFLKFEIKIFLSFVSRMKNLFHQSKLYFKR